MFMKNIKNEDRKLLLAALKCFPEFNVLDCLGEGNKGKAYLLGNNMVLKITCDKYEYNTAMILKNKKLKHIINIYDGWSFDYIDNEGYSDSLFAIIEEYIDTSSKKDTIKEFITVFKHAWFSIYFSDIENRLSATFDDLDEYMRYSEMYSNAIEFTKQYILNKGVKIDQQEDFEDIYNQLILAYKELYQNAPNSHLDLNAGNIGFTSNGVLKIFDMQ